MPSMKGTAAIAAAVAVMGEAIYEDGEDGYCGETLGSYLILEISEGVAVQLFVDISQPIEF